jgi:hypothetical protein
MVLFLILKSIYLIAVYKQFSLGGAFSQDEQNGFVYMKVRRYENQPWDPTPLLLIERHVPENKYPKRLDPKWVHEDGENVGKPFAGQQLVDLVDWPKNINKIKPLYTKTGTAQFWLDFHQNLKDRVIPPLLRPVDPEGPSQLEKLITFCKQRDPCEVCLSVTFSSNFLF